MGNYSRFRRIPPCFHCLARPTAVMVNQTSRCLTCNAARPCTLDNDLDFRFTTWVRQAVRKRLRSWSRKSRLILTPCEPTFWIPLILTFQVQTPHLPYQLEARYIRRRLMWLCPIK